MTGEQQARVDEAWESQRAAIARAQVALGDVERMAAVLREVIDELRAEIGGNHAAQG